MAPSTPVWGPPPAPRDTDTLERKFKAKAAPVPGAGRCISGGNIGALSTGPLGEDGRRQLVHSRGAGSAPRGRALWWGAASPGDGGSLGQASGRWRALGWRGDPKTRTVVVPVAAHPLEEGGLLDGHPSASGPFQRPRTMQTQPPHPPQALQFTPPNRTQPSPPRRLCRSRRSSCPAGPCVDRWRLRLTLERVKVDLGESQG